MIFNSKQFKVFKVQKFSKILKYIRINPQDCLYIISIIIWMQSSTISISNLPHNTTADDVRKIFHAFSVKNVHIDGNTAFVLFDDSGDFQTLDIQFDEYKIAQLNNARIDIVEKFDWNSVKTQNSLEEKKSKDHSSDKYQDLMGADIKHLILIKNCDKKILDTLSIEEIKSIFHDFHSVNRIIKRDNQVIIQFLDLAQIQLLYTKIDNFNVAQLGKNSIIYKAEDSNIRADQFTSEWSKMHSQESQITQATSQMGYGKNKKQIEDSQDRFGSIEQKPSQQVLHQYIIPPFDKKTSMEVNFLSEQSKLGYDQQSPHHHQPIHEANTHQQLDYTSELKIDQEETDRFGYEAQEKKQQQALLKQKQEQKKQKEAQQKQIQAQKVRQQALQAQKVRQQALRKQQEQQERKRETEKKLKEQAQKKIRQQEEQKKREQQQLKALQIQKQRHKQAQRQTQRQAQQQANGRRYSQLLDQQLKQKLHAQRQKLNKQEAQRKDERNAQFQKKKSLGYEASQNLSVGHGPTGQGEMAAKETQFLRQAQVVAEKKLGYVVEKVRQEGAKIIDSVGSCLQNIGDAKKHTICRQQQWSVKPDVGISSYLGGTQKQIQKMLVTVTLAIWVIFLLYQ